MDIHNLPEGTTAEDIAKAHAKDVETQRKYGVEYHKYWVNESSSKVFCLAHAPSAEAAACVHREAHGLLAEKIIEVEPDVAEVFLGGTETNNLGAVLLPGGGADARDPGIRTVLFTDIVDSTTLTHSLGDEAALALFDVHNAVVGRTVAPELVRRETDGVGGIEDSTATVGLEVGEVERTVEASDDPALALHVPRGAGVAERMRHAHSHTIADRERRVCSVRMRTRWDRPAARARQRESPTGANRQLARGGQPRFHRECRRTGEPVLVVR